MMGDLGSRAARTAEIHSQALRMRFGLPSCPAYHCLLHARHVVEDPSLSREACLGK